jgi:hypothetical protein
MKKSHMLRTVLLSTVFILLAIVLMTPVASAHTAAPARGTATATSQVPDIPNVNIVTQHHRSVFSSSTIHCKGRSGQVGFSITNGPQQSGQAGFTITNTTDKDQQIGVQGHNTLILGPGVEVRLIVAPGVYMYSLKSNRLAHLTIIAS